MSAARAALLELAAHHRSELLWHAPLTACSIVVVPSAYAYSRGELHGALLSLSLVCAAALVAHAARQTRSAIDEYCSAPATEDRLVSAAMAVADDASHRILAVPMTLTLYALLVGVGPRLLALALFVHALNVIAARRASRGIERALERVRAQPMVYARLDGVYAEWSALGMVRLRRLAL